MATMTAEDRPRYDELISKGMPSSVTIKKIEAEKDIKVKSEKAALRGKEIKEGEAKAKAEEVAKIKKETERSEKESEREAEKEKREKEKEKSSREKDREKDRERDRDRRDRDRDKGRDRDRDKGRDRDRYSKDYSKDYDKGGKDKMARKGDGMVSHIVSDLQEEGGNFVGEGIGLIGGLYLAEYVGNAIEKSVTPQSSTFGNVISWALNNFPKVVAYYLVNRYVGYYEERGIIGGAMYGAKISLPTSIMLDTYYRLAHKKLLNMTESNESVIKEKLNQENNILRIRLQSLQSLQYVLDSLKDRLKLSESRQPIVIFRQALSDNSEQKQMLSSNNPVIEQQQPIIEIEQAKHNDATSNDATMLSSAIELYHKNSFKNVDSIGSLFGML